MSGPADVFRAVAGACRAIPDALGLRDTTVSVVVEQWSSAVGADDATLVSSTATTLSPSPRVTITAWEDSPFGGGSASGASARRQAADVTINRITPPYPGGGFDLATLNPRPLDATQRVCLVLAGGAFDAAGERFTVTKVDGSASIHTILYAKRVNT